jgi:beta-lactamase superfamily II metal-dependent hydrolase
MRLTDRIREAVTAVAVAGGVLASGVLAAPAAPNWGLRVVFFSVGQADAIVAVAPDGDAAVIDAARGAAGADSIAAFLADSSRNGVGTLTKVKMGFVTHYDLDHMGGFRVLPERGIRFRSVYDQGPSLKRRGSARYSEYVAAVGDPNDNDHQDPGEDSFVRKRARLGEHWKLGDATVRVVSVRGNTKGTDRDLDLEPSDQKIDENPGSIALFITLGDFELYTAGDQTSDDWKPEPDTEIGVVRSGVLGERSRVDVLKANHHGSDTSNGHDFLQALRPTVAVVSSTYTKGDKLPKRVAIQQLVEAGALVYITGNGHNPEGRFEDAATTVDDDFKPPEGSVVNEAGTVEIIVNRNGQSFRVSTAGMERVFSAVDQS